MGHRNAWYTRFAKWAARVSGRPATFILALGLIGAWAIVGPVLQFNDTWQLTINTATTILTFLMVFVIQSTQNRDTQAIQIKLDELIRSSQGAHNALLDLEELEDLQLEAFAKRYETLAEEARAALQRGRSDTGTPEP
jgi:low affinity Fe/Cu permease